MAAPGDPAGARAGAGLLAPTPVFPPLLPFHWPGLPGHLFLQKCPSGQETPILCTMECGTHQDIGDPGPLRLYGPP